MIDLELNYNKINEYLNSFLGNDVKNTNVSESACKENEKSQNTNILSQQNLTFDSTAKKHVEKRSSSDAKTLPTNREHFKARLVTFEFGLWTCTQISPLICASYGWKLSDKNILNCVTCNAMICSSLPLPNKVEAYVNFTNILKNRLKCGHKEWCGWSNNPSPSMFLHPPLKATVHYFRKLFQDANKLCTLNHCLPYIDIKKISEKLDVNEKQIAQFFGRETELDKIHITAALLVLCGWVVETCELLRCNLCLRKIGLWNFLPLSKEEEYLKLGKRHEENKAKNLRNENRRRERERRAKIKEEEERIVLEKERQALEEQRKAEEEAMKIKLVLEKITRIENDQTEGEFEDNEEAEDLGEDQENILLSEDNVEVDEENLRIDRERDDIPEENTEMELEGAESNYVSQKSSDDTSDSDSLSGDNSPKSSKGSSLQGEVEGHSSAAEQEDSMEDEQHFNKNCDSEEDERERDQESHYDSEENEEAKDISQSQDSLQEDSDEEAIDTSPHHQESLHEDTEEEAIDASQSQFSEEGEEGINSSHQEIQEDSEEEENAIIISQSQESFHEDSEEDDGINSTQHQQSLYEDIEEEDNNQSDDELWLEAVGGTREGNVNSLSSSSSDSNEKYRPQSITTRKRPRSSDSSSDYDTEERTVSKYPRLEEDLEELIKEKMSSSVDDSRDEVKSIEKESDVSDDEEEDVDEDDAIYDAMKNSLFDPLEQHRHWCGCIVDCSSLYVEKETESVIGYKIVPPQLKSLLPEMADTDLVLSEKYASNLECFRTVRNMLNSWTVPENSEENSGEEEEMEI